MKLGDRVKVDNKVGRINKIHYSGEIYLVDDTWYHVDDIKAHKYVGQRYKVIEDNLGIVEPGDIVELVEICDSKCSTYERISDGRSVVLLDIDYRTPEVGLTTTMDILEVGMLVELRSGTIYVVLPNTSMYEGDLMFVSNTGFMSLGEYDEYGNYEFDYDIVKIYDNTKFMGSGLFSTESREVLYERSN